MAGANSVRSILYALFANTSIAIAKGVAAFFTGSSAMLAESIHSLADAGNQILLLLGMRQSGKAPTEEHPLGHGKAVYVWSFLVAIILFSVGGMFSVYEGWHKLQHPEPVVKAWIAISVLVFGIIVEGISFRVCIQEVDKERRGRSYWRWFRESRTSELIVIFGEDLAALLGLTFALIAVLLTLVTGNTMFDALGTILIGVLLLVIAWFIAIEVKALLIGQSVERPVREEMRSFLESRTEVAEIFRVLTLQLGPEQMVAVKARMAPGMDRAAMVAAINAVERDFRTQFPSVAWLFFEPDVTDQ